MLERKPIDNTVKEGQLIYIPTIDDAVKGGLAGVIYVTNEFYEYQYEESSGHLGYNRGPFFNSYERGQEQGVVLVPPQKELPKDIEEAFV